MDKAVERRQQRRAALEVPVERGGIDTPLALDTFDHRRLAGLAYVDRLDRHGGGLPSGDAECPKPPLVLDPLRLLDRRDNDVGRVDTLGHVPHPLPSNTPRAIRNSSIWVTLRLLVHPLEGHGTTDVSGMSRDVIGPELPSSFRMSRRKRSLSRNQVRDRS